MKNLNLTDEQFLELLKRGLKLLEERYAKNPNTLAKGVDSTDFGDKYTETNVGLCNEEQLCTKETALFPDEYPQRKSMKYLDTHQKCPLDDRGPGSSDMNGCFYTCKFFQKGLRHLKPIIELYKISIKHTENQIKVKNEQTI